MPDAGIRASAPRTHRSLLRELLLRSGGVVLSLLLAAGAFAYALAKHYANEVHDRWLYDSARTLAAQVHFAGNELRLDLPKVAIEMFVYDDLDRIYYEIADGTGTAIAANAALPATARLGAGDVGRFGDTTIDGRPVRTVTVAVAPPAGGPPARVTVGETLNKRHELTREILLELVPMQLALILAGALALYWALRTGLRALSQATSAIRARSPLETRPVAIASPAPVEIQPLIDAINDLLARIDAAQRAQQRFLANAAHQLRTPVAGLEVQLERALRDPTSAGREEALAHVRASVRRLGRLLHQFMTLARMEPDAHAGPRMTRTDLAVIAREAVERHVDEAVARSADLGYAGARADVFVEGEPTLIAEMLRNLIENALQYGGPDAQVTVGVLADPPRVFVEDNGPGVDPAERERVWERFYRSPRSPGVGSGLGLAIVKEIAERHGARVALESGEEIGGGTRVTITFPPVAAGAAPAAPVMPARIPPA